MVLVVKEGSSSGNIIFQTDNGNPPEIMFTNKSFIEDDAPVWSENAALQREGNFSHYLGSNDDKVRVEIYLTGINRKTNLALVKQIKNQVFYLDASDIDSNLSGKYVVNKNSFRISYVTKRNETFSRIVINTTWRKYNN